MAMKNVANDPKQSYNLFWWSLLSGFANVHRHKQNEVYWYVQWLTERCFKHAQVPGFNLVGVVSIKKWSGIAHSF